LIDIESILYTEIATALRAEFPDIFVTGEVVNAPPQFPCVSIVERSNTSYLRTLDGSHVENHASVLYQNDYYSNLATGKKSQCKAIAKLVDDIMIGYNFVRVFLEPIDNADTKIHRMTARYTAVVSKDNRIYRN
jgi:hypothetical protein